MNILPNVKESIKKLPIGLTCGKDKHIIRQVEPEGLMTFGRTRIFDLAREYGYSSRAELARAMGLSESYLCLLQQGKRDPLTKTIVRAALRLFPDRTFEELFEIEEDREDSTDNRGCDHIDEVA